MALCDKCGIEVVEVDNPFRVEIRPRRGLEDQCIGGEGCRCGWPPKQPEASDGGPGLTVPDGD